LSGHDFVADVEPVFELFAGLRAAEVVDEADGFDGGLGVDAVGGFELGLVAEAEEAVDFEEMGIHGERCTTKPGGAEGGKGELLRIHGEETQGICVERRVGGAYDGEIQGDAMSSGKLGSVPASEITPESAYLNRRAFIRAGIVAGSAVATGLLYRQLNAPKRAVAGGGPVLAPIVPVSAGAGTQPANASGAGDDELAKAFRTDEKQTSFEDITHYNNFYEFSTDKGEVADAAKNFASRPWVVSVKGMVARPREFDIDDLLKIAPPEERVYRMRCVEAWSMVIPWIGFPLSRLLERVQPLGSAKYVAFTTLNDSKRMPNQKGGVLDWPYVEGLRMDEAMNPLTILASGLYGKQLPPQNGAPLRLVVPWKYGLKGIKSIVKIELTDKQPPTTWNIQGPREYGFYSNVNPEVNHPRWSQATERRIGEIGRRDTLMFNGYAEQVGYLYAGMDLKANF
jgi:sulfoxide reductase catalytic subunit YedY